MAKVKIYGKDSCSYCQQAKMYFSNLGVDFDYEEISEDKVLELSKETGIETVPQIFIDGKFIGGWITTKGLIESGELDKSLNS